VNPYGQVTFCSSVIGFLHKELCTSFLSFNPVGLNYVCRLWLLCMQIVGHVICPYRIILYLLFNAEFCLAIMR